MFEYLSIKHCTANKTYDQKADLLRWGIFLKVHQYIGIPFVCFFLLGVSIIIKFLN